jgi:protein-S-isoprenylcysteine O-methyltransferase Ste14
LQSFRSWRFAAKLDEGHRLATGGPFGFVRHPIYLGLALIGFGTFLWAPTILVLGGFVLLAVTGDMRARAEEVILRQAFGADYESYSAKTKRFLPGLY